MIARSEMEDPIGEELEEPIDGEQSEDLRSKRSWSQRTFSRLGRGSVRGSIFSLLSQIIGIGCLLLPYILRQSGLLLGLGMLLLAAIIAYIGLYSLILVSHKYKIYHYPDLVRRILGKEIGLLMDISFLLDCYVSMIAYQVSVGRFVPSLCVSLNIHFDEFTEVAAVKVMILILIIIPLGLFRSLTDIRYITIFSTFSVVFLVLVVIVEFPYFIEINNFSEIEYAKFDLNIFVSFSVVLFSYLCHTTAPIVQGELYETSVRRMNKVGFRSIVTISLLYTFLSLFGYLSLLQDTPVLIPNRKPPDSISNDWAMVTAKILVGLAAIIAIPSLLHPTRTIFCQTILRIKDKPSLCVHVTVSLFLTISSTIISIVYPRIVVLLSVLGGVFGVFFAIILPCNLYEAYLLMKSYQISVRSFTGVLFVLYNVLFFVSGIIGIVVSAILE